MIIFNLEHYFHCSNTKTSVLVHTYLYFMCFSKIMRDHSKSVKFEFQKSSVGKKNSVLIQAEKS